MKLRQHWSTILSVVGFTIVFGLLPELNVYVVFAFDLSLLLVAVVVAIWSRHKLRGELQTMWRLADQLGYSTQQVRLLAETVYPQFKYGLIDWDQSRGTAPQFFPSRRVVRRVLATLQQRNSEQ